MKSVKKKGVSKLCPFEIVLHIDIQDGVNNIKGVLFYYISELTYATIFGIQVCAFVWFPEQLFEKHFSQLILVLVYIQQPFADLPTGWFSACGARIPRRSLSSCVLLHCKGEVRLGSLSPWDFISFFMNSLLFVLQITFHVNLFLILYSSLSSSPSLYLSLSVSDLSVANQTHSIRNRDITSCVQIFSYVPIFTCDGMIMVSLSYFLVGLYPSVSAFLHTLVITVLISWCTTSLGVMICSVCFFKFLF